MSDSERPFTAGQRPTEIGPFSGAQPGTSRMRPIPAPWIDCAACGWRHYPNTTGGAWHIVTACVSCGEPLQGVVDHTDEKQEAPSGVEPADDDGEAGTRARSERAPSAEAGEEGGAPRGEGGRD